MGACFFILTLFLITSCTEFEDRVFQNLLQLCPGQYVPAENETLVENQTADFESCCTDFYNVSQILTGFTNAGLNHGVYSPAGDTGSRGSNFDDLVQTCLFPRTDQESLTLQSEKAYLMVIHASDDGCIPTDNTSMPNITDTWTRPTCNDSEVTPIRQFHPVYSPATGLIYKNPHCAYCHGQYDVTLWQQHVQCGLDKPFSYDCNFRFFYTGNNQDIAHLECFTDYFSSCPATLMDSMASLPPRVDLSKQELVRACELDHLPRFEHDFVAKNVFCYVCMYVMRGKSLLPRSTCSNPTAPFRGLEKQAFTRILDNKVIDRYHAADDIECDVKTSEKACLAELCPLGQVMISESDGNHCRMESIQWTLTNSNLALLVLLKFEETIAIDKETLEKMSMQSPWQIPWERVCLYVPFARNIDIEYLATPNHAMNKYPVESIDHLYVEVMYIQSTANPSDLIAEIQETLPKVWTLNIDNTTHKVNQSFSRHSFNEIKINYKSYFIPSWRYSTKLNTHERLFYKIIRSRPVSTYSIFLNKLLICKQYELHSSDFEVFSVESTVIALYYRMVGKLLFDNEFMVRRGMDGEQTFRVCISDLQIASHANNKRTILTFPSLIQYWLLYVFMATINNG